MQSCQRQLKNHTQRIESGFQDIATCLATRISAEDASTLVLLSSIEIAPINSDILKQVEVRKRKGNKNKTLGVGDNMQTISCGDKCTVTLGALVAVIVTVIIYLEYASKVLNTN